MTLTSTVSRNTYPGAGSAGPFPYTFRIFEASDLRVLVRDADDETSLLAYPDDYTVTGVGESGGSITLDTPLAVGETLVIRRVRPYTQTTDLRNQGTFYPETHEDVFDHLVMLAQQLDVDMQATVQLDETFDPNAYNLSIIPGPVGSVLGWGVNGLVNLTAVGGGIQGPPGEDGEQGPPGFGVPPGGIAGQVLAKINGNDYETEWVDPSGSVGPQGPPGADGTDGADGADGTDGVDGVGVPAGGLTGQVLAKSSNSDYVTTWVNQSGVGTFVEKAGGATGGHMTGHLGIGISPLFPLHIEASVPNEKVAVIRNTAVNGYGLKLRTGDNSKYALKVVNAAETADIFQVFGTGVVHIGTNAAFLEQMQAYGQWFLSISADDVLAGGDAGVVMTSDNPKVSHMMYATGGDRGFRIITNMKPPSGGHTYSDTTLSQQRLDMEQDGVTSVSYWKPYDTAAGAWDALGGKSILLNAKGRTGGDQRDEFAFIGSGHVGRGLDLGVVPAGGAANIAEVVIRMKGSDGAEGALAANPLWLYTNSGLRNIKAKDFAALAGGDMVLYY